MFGDLFSFRRNKKSPVARVPDGARVYAIGDIHGRADLMHDLLAQIVADDSRRGPADTQVIFLGDLVDRGPASAEVVETARLLAANDSRYRFIQGNHEEVFLKALGGDRKALTFFTRIGGKETILSYGVSKREYDDADYDTLMALFSARVPDAHVAFVAAFEDMIEIGDYVFVHAGVRPGVPLASQKPSDLRWIRQEFLESRERPEKVVVHGHTIFETVEEQPFRIGLDTGAYASGVLTAMGFEGDRRWTIRAEGSRADAA